MSSPSPARLDDGLEAVFERLVGQHVGAAGRAAGRKPMAFLVAGQPGSGKSRLAAAAMSRCVADGGTPVHVDPDKLRADVPGYEELAAEDLGAAFQHSQPMVSVWAEWLRDHAVCRGLDVVLEGLFKTPANTRRLLGQLSAAGYETRLSVKVVPREVSLLQIERRYERQLAGQNVSERVPRRLAAEAHDIGYDAMPPLVELAEQVGLDVTLYDMGNKPIAVSGTRSAELRRLRAAPLGSPEQEAVYSLLYEVQRYREARGAPPAEPESALRAAIEMIAIRD